MKLISSLALAFMLLGQIPLKAQPFEIVAFGDAPYAIPDDYPKVDRLINAINAINPAFSLHIGDVKSGSSPCSDEVLKKSFDQFQQIKGALVFSIGDNEWTDCHRKRAGSYDPIERLAKVREIYFPKEAKSLGQTPIALQRQSETMPQFAKFVENARYVKNDVHFIILHVVGSNNGFEPRNMGAVTEFFEREKANIAWLDFAYKQAETEKAKAIVIAFQADTQDIVEKFGTLPAASGFVGILRAIERNHKKFNKPSLVIHGDAHSFEIGQFLGSDKKPIAGLLRLQVMGARDVHGVRVMIDTQDPGVFGFKRLLVPENGLH